MSRFTGIYQKNNFCLTLICFYIIIFVYMNMYYYSMAVPVYRDTANYTGLYSAEAEQPTYKEVLKWKKSWHLASWCPTQLG